LYKITFFNQILSIDDNKSDWKIEFASTKYPAYPDFLDVRLKSFKIFFTRNQIWWKRQRRALQYPSWKIFQLQIQEIILYWNLDYFVDPPRYTIQECIERGLTIVCPKSKVKLYCTDPETKILKLLFKMYIWDNPVHDTMKNFVINVLNVLLFRTT
jgi:DNA-directed RNA polymerase subunit beta